MPRSGSPALPKGALGKSLLQLFHQPLRRDFGQSPLCGGDCLGAAPHRFVQSDQRLDQRPSGLFRRRLLLRLDVAKMFDGAIQSRQRRLQRILRASRTLGLQLQLVPQRRKGFDQRQQANRRCRFRRPGLEFRCPRFVLKLFQFLIGLCQPFLKTTQDIFLFQPHQHQISASDSRTEVGRRRPRCR